MLSEQSKRKVNLILMGGLGNQLFQISAALAFHKQGELQILRLKTQNINMENSGFSLKGTEVSFKNIETNFLSRKLINLTIRLSSKGALHHIPEALLRFGLRVGNDPELRRLAKTKMIVNSGIGFDASITEPSSESTMLGYFQTWRYLAEAEIVERIVFPTQNTRFYNLLNAIKERKPIVVHLRMGDYLDEPKFGIPSRNYFLNAITEMRSLNPNHEVWVFSNERESAQEYLSMQDLGVYFVPNLELAPGEVLELMRHGAGYVISNSTFSWWAAQLAYDRKAHVICPTPWYSGIDEPVDMIPSLWKREFAGYRDLQMHNGLES